MSVVLDVQGLTVRYSSANPLLDSRYVTAVDDISFQVEEGETVALVGASGSGKSSAAKAILRLAPATGRVRVLGNEVLDTGWQGPPRDFRKQVQMVFQDPYASLNPAHTIRHHITRPLTLHHTAKGDLGARAVALLDEVGLSPGGDYIDRYPHALSGGQRQRVAIARALATEPKLLLADEPTASLDVSLRAGILGLLRDLCGNRGLAMVLITHDLGAARQIANRVAVMDCGRIVEIGPTADVLERPTHPYTRQLRAAARRDSRLEPSFHQA